MPRVTIGLPVRNGERYLEQALRSLLSQSFEDFELIISDNSSTDRTAEISQDIARQDSRVRYHRFTEDVGAARNFNTVFHLGTARYFKWAAHDDVHHPDYISACSRVLDERSDIVLAHSKVELIDSNGAVLRLLDEGLESASSADVVQRFSALIGSDHWCTSIFGLIRRDVLARTRLIEGFTSSDRVLLAELALRGRFHTVPRTLFQNREHPHRSIRSTDIRSAERRIWFSPERSGTAPSMPFVRTWVGYLRAVARTRRGARAWIGLTKALMTWLPQNRGHLYWDIRGLVGWRIRRLAGLDSDAR